MTSPYNDIERAALNLLRTGNDAEVVNQYVSARYKSMMSPMLGVGVNVRSHVAVQLHKS